MLLRMYGADMIFCDFSCRPPAPRRSQRVSRKGLEVIENSTKDHGMR
jgi:hypothetical protein